MNNDQLIKLETEFEKMKKELEFSSSFDDLEEIFFLRDMVFQNKFVSTRLSRQICSRIVETYSGWVSRLNLIINRNPNYYPYSEESKLFENDKTKIYELIHKIYGHISKNALIALKKDKVLEAKFIDDSVILWKALKPDLIEVLTKIDDFWINKPIDFLKDQHTVNNEYFG